MKIALFAFAKKVMAMFVALLTSLSIIAPDKSEPITRPDDNTVTAYDVSSADYELSIDVTDEIHDISDLLFGVFFEDINFAADGGLYAEKIANRSFEFFNQAAGDKLFAWSAVGNVKHEVVEDKNGALNQNNLNYLVIENTSSAPAGVENRGYMEGMSCESGEAYKLSFYAKSAQGYTGKVYVNLVADGNVAASAVVDGIGAEWAKYEATLNCKATSAAGATLQLLIDNGKAEFDMVSLFPVNTYKNRENGMRADLGKAVADLEPTFLRFPGGCIIEGYDTASAYNWKHSVGVDENGEPLLFNGKYGDVATRTYDYNIWTDFNATDDIYPSFMSYGLGFYEYFQFAEDIGAIGVPVLNCGLFCQMRGMGPVDMDSELFAQYIQDMFDLIEFCRGDETTKWGRIRCDLGHKEPFELKYICIGNENEGEDYFVRYEAFLEAFLEAKANDTTGIYDGLELIYSSGASDATHSAQYIKSYVFAENWLKEHNETDINVFAGATDQHYYNDPSWFRENVDYYDESNYTRNALTETHYGGGIGVFVGEYAARSNRLEAALAEAAYMTGLERNGDIVKMAAYAPLFGNATAGHWSPDLIWYNNSTVAPSVNYYVQKLFSNHAGTTLLSSELTGADIPEDDLSGMVGVGTWYTSARFDNVVVTDNESGKVLDKDDFCTTGGFLWNWQKASDGKWKIKDGALVNTTTDMTYSDTGSVVYFGNPDWSNYTYTVECTKLDGEEGFLIPFAVKDTQNNFFWNIGGWQNTLSCVQHIENNAKTGQMPGTVTDFTVETGKTYQIKIVVDGTCVQGYIDGELQFDIDTASQCNAEAYQVVSTDETGDTIIKLVNVTDESRTFAVSINGTPADKAKVYQLKGETLDDVNVLGQAESCSIEEITVDNISEAFNYTVPKYSVTVMRIAQG